MNTKQNITHDTYKGFDIEFFKVNQGFNMYILTITKYKHKGFREEKYFMKRINTYTKSKKEALEIAHKYIDTLFFIKYLPNGKHNNMGLPSIYDKIGETKK